VEKSSGIKNTEELRTLKEYHQSSPELLEVGCTHIRGHKAVSDVQIKHGMSSWSVNLLDNNKFKVLVLN
jgi:hypothetical protein